MRLFALTLLLLSSAAPPALAQSGKPSVAVMQMDDLAGSGQAASFSTMIESAVAGTGKFRLIERGRLGTLVAEQGRARAGVVTTNRPGKTGGFEGVDYLIYGTITSVSAGSSQNLGASLGMSMLGSMLSQGGRSATNCSNSSATLAVDIKITDSDSGEIKYTTRISETQRSAASCDGRASVDTALLFRSAADKVASGLVTSIYPVQVAAVQPDGVLVLNYGEGALAQGAVMAVFSKGAAIRDPASGEILGNDETKLGLIRVSEVSSRMSKAVPVTAFAQSPGVGSIVRPASSEDLASVAPPRSSRRR